MSENAMARMLSVIEKHGEKVNSPDVRIGVILAPPPAIRVKLDDRILEAEDCYISEYLLAGYRREAMGTIISNTQPASCHVTHAHGIANAYTDDIVYTDTLKPGDLVEVMPLKGMQLYVIENKVVKL